MQCDDGNLISGDGCSKSCTIEAGFVCVPGAGGSVDICVTGTSTHVEGFENGLAVGWWPVLGASKVGGVVVPNQGDFSVGPAYRYSGVGGLRLLHNGAWVTLYYHHQPPLPSHAPPML